MKKIFKFAALGIAAATVSLSFGGCETTKWYSYDAYKLSTTVSAIMYTTEGKADSLSEQIGEVIDEMEAAISTSVKTSYVYAFNEAQAGESVEINKLTYTVFSEAIRLYNLTDGYYNPGVYYCSDLYAFTPEHKSWTEYDHPYDRQPQKTDDGISFLPLPDEKYVEAFKELAKHFGDVTLKEEDGKYYAVKPADAFVVVDDVTYSLKIDFGGIGKGYVADLVSDIFDSEGIKYANFSFGTSSAVLKKYKEDTPEWTLRLTNPRSSFDYFLSYKIANANISTSGDYEQYYVVNGKRYCHIIDPTTGRPIDTGIIEASIAGGNAMEDDALTTAIMAMGLDKAIDFINNNLSDRKVTFVYLTNDGKMQVITNMKDEEYSVTSESFTVVSQLDENGKIVYNG
jgi:thiamine biosynthesis lipoprotein